MKKRAFVLVLLMFFLINIFPASIMAEGKIDYDVHDFAEFKQVVKAIDDSTSDVEHIIHLRGDINFAEVNYPNTSEYNIIFRKNVTILGYGHTINLGEKLSQGYLTVGNGKTLSLGKENQPEASKLTITSSPKSGYRSSATVIVGIYDESATLNMYDGVEITGNRTNGSSLGSAVNIVIGTFNMYGGDIHHNINEGGPGVGGAVAGHSDGNEKIFFNMYGGRIRENETQSTMSIAFGAGCFWKKRISVCTAAVSIIILLRLHQMAANPTVPVSVFPTLPQK